MRPASVWITQILLGIFSLFFLFIWIFNTFRVIRKIGLAILTLKFMAFTIFLFSLIVLFIIAFWGLMKRQIYGKWSGVVSIFIIWVIIVYSQLFPADGPIKRYEYNDAAELLGAFMAQIVIHLLFLIPMCKLMFSKKVNIFFTNKAPNSINPVT